MARVEGISDRPAVIRQDREAGVVGLCTDAVFQGGLSGPPGAVVSHGDDAGIEPGGKPRHLI